MPLITVPTAGSKTLLPFRLGLFQFAVSLVIIYYIVSDVNELGLISFEVRDETKLEA